MQMDIINYVIKKNKISIPVVWISRSLHNQPKKLHESIQNVINKHQNVDEILLSYGLCGNAVIGLRSKETELIVPAFDDCICQMLYTQNKRNGIWEYKYPEKGCFYLTREWTIDQESIYSQCEMIYDQFGMEYGQQIIKEIYNEYHTMIVLRTGAYDVEKIRGYVDKAANATGMCVKIQEGSCKVMENLLLENYDETILVLHPEEVIKDSLYMKCKNRYCSQ